jgi:hypothetical protein
VIDPFPPAFLALNAGLAALARLTLFGIQTTFPSSAPYRLDQVMGAPVLLTVLTLGQVLMAVLLQTFARPGQRKFWWLAAIMMLLLTFIFFTLASWGTSDITKLNHFFALQRDGGTSGEPLWWLIGPLIPWLPYRMATIHGLVACAYCATAILLGRAWNLPAWSGWWALLITGSPMLRSFLHNGISRQALAVLLLLPLFLRLADLLPIRRWQVGLGVLLSAGCHTTFPFSVAMAASPWLISGRSILVPSFRRQRWWWLVLPVLLVSLAGIVPFAWQKLHTYIFQISFFSHYPIKPPVQHLQQAMLVGFLGVCWQRRLGPVQLWSCSLTRLLAFFATAYIGLQTAVRQEWLASIAFRLSDGVGFFLLILFIAWLRHYNAMTWLLPAIIVTLHYWLVMRVLPSGAIPCGRNDEFLCIPDRLPWQVRY